MAWIVAKMAFLRAGTGSLPPEGTCSNNKWVFAPLLSFESELSSRHGL